MKKAKEIFDVVTVTLNPAIDRTVTISEFTAGAVNRVEQVRANPGGKGVNVASALANYGLRVAATGFLGRENCAQFEALFSRKKIEDQFVRIAGQTRVGIKISDPVLKQTTDINFPGPAIAATDLATLRERLDGVSGKWFVLAGSVPPGIDETIYRDLIGTLKARGGKVVLDASGEALRHGIDAVPDVIKPNIHELETLVGKRLETSTAVIQAARKLVSKGIGLVVVSMGKEGACFVTGTEVVIARPPDIEVKSTVGAGDAMVAGIVSAALKQLPLADCARLATAFSVEALTRLEPGLASPASLHESLEKVTIDVPSTGRSKQAASHAPDQIPGKATLVSARKDFQRARQRAALEQIIGALSGKSAELLSYEEVRHKLRAVETAERELKDVPLDAIVGTTVQFEDFTRSFLPRQERDRELWTMVNVIASGAHNPPPVELYQIGDAYFVKHGHYRVSVARQRGDKQIRACVTEVRTNVPLPADVQPSDLILKSEQSGFLAHTGLDTLRPGSDLSVTSPEHYAELAEHIDVHRYFMGLDRKREIPYGEAVAHWYDEVYLPVVAIIRSQKILKDFPGRTEADLYLWISKHRAELMAEPGPEIKSGQAAADFVSRFSPKPQHLPGRVWRRGIL